MRANNDNDNNGNNNNSNNNNSNNNEKKYCEEDDSLTSHENVSRYINVRLMYIYLCKPLYIPYVYA